MSPSFVFSNALQHTFCFPIYMYPVLLIPGVIIHTIFHELFNVGDTLNRLRREKYKWIRKCRDRSFDHYLDNVDNTHKDESEIIPFHTKSIEFPDKESIMKSFMEYTPLSYDTIILLIDEYYYDSEYEDMLKEAKDMRDFKVLQKVFDYYSILTFMFNGFSFVIIVWINLEWIIINKYSLWLGMQSLFINILTMQPSSKICNIAMILYGRNEYYMGNDTLYLIIFNLWYYTPIMYIGGIVMYLLPSWIYYLPIWIIVLSGCFCCNALDLCGPQTPECSKRVSMLCLLGKKWWIIKQMIVPILLATIAYCLINWICISMACVYSGQIKGNERWYLCLRDSFNSPYCANSSMDWSDWRSNILLISWLLF